MLDKDTLSQLKAIKTEIRGSKDLHKAVVRGTRFKYGFARLRDGRDILLPAEQMLRVYPDDEVEVNIIEGERKRPYAKIERVFKSPLETLVGKVIYRKNHCFLEADLAGIQQNLFVPPPFRKESKDGDYAVAKIIQHPFKEGKSQVKIVEIISAKEHPIPLAYMLKKYNIPQTADFEKEKDDVLARYQDALKNPTRKDLSAENFISIDGDFTQDVDDALFAQETDAGWKLFVAIADPCELVENDSVIEKQARALSSSIYFPKHKIPMLPNYISSDLASLVENELRLSLVCEMDIARDGSISNINVFEAIIKSKAKLSYTQVSDCLAGQTNEDSDISSDIQAQINILNALSSSLASKHSKRAIQNTNTDIQLHINNEYKIEQVEPFKSTPANLLVESIMICCNEAVASWMHEKNIHALYNTHRGFRESQLTLIKQLLASRAPELSESDLGQLDNFSQLMQLASTQHTLVTEETTEASLLLILNGMLERSEIKPNAEPHFGLGVTRYLNFTSPLRRYQDFLVHRNIKASLAGKDTSAFTNESIEALNEQTQRNRQASRQLKDWLICDKLNTLKKETFKAEITQVQGTHIVVTLADYQISGNLDMRPLKAFKFNGSKKTYTLNQTRLVLGQIVNVRLMKIDWKNFAPVFIWQAEK